MRQGKVKDPGRDLKIFKKNRLYAVSMLRLEIIYSQSNMSLLLLLILFSETSVIIYRRSTAVSLNDAVSRIYK